MCTHSSSSFTFPFAPFSVPLYPRQLAPSLLLNFTIRNDTSLFLFQTIEKIAPQEDYFYFITLDVTFIRIKKN